jgi:hypothetical protein
MPGLRFSSLSVSIVVVLLVTHASMGITQNYGDYTLNAWNRHTLSDVWDLTAGDLTISYRLDLSNMTTAGWNVFQMGIAKQGTANWDTGVWLQSWYAIGGSDPNTFNKNDKNVLQHLDHPSTWEGTDETDYNTTDPNTVGTPFGSDKSVNIWFDRDGVDPYQPGLWGWNDGGNYNTGGIYDIVLQYHAIDATQGTVFATINSLGQGIYTGATPDYSQAPDHYPAGLSFTAAADLGGDMSNLLVHFGQGAGGSMGTGEYSRVIDLTVTGVPEPASLSLVVLGLFMACGRRHLRQ